MQGESVVSPNKKYSNKQTLPYNNCAHNRNASMMGVALVPKGVLCYVCVNREAFSVREETTTFPADWVVRTYLASYNREVGEAVPYHKILGLLICQSRLMPSRMLRYVTLAVIIFRTYTVPTPSKKRVPICSTWKVKNR